MAFSPEGMFYLGKEDLEPTISSAGTGLRSMFGLQNEKEAVDSILQSGDFSTPESRKAILEQIRAISPKAYYKYAKLENEKLEADQKIQHSIDKPLIKQRWNLEGKYGAAASFAPDNLTGLEGYEELSASIKANPKKARLLITTFINKLPTEVKGAYKTEFSDFMKTKEENYMTTWLRAGVKSDGYSGSFAKKDLTLGTDDGGSDTGTETDIGTSGVEGITQIDPSSSQWDQAQQGNKGKIEVGMRVGKVYNKLRKSITGKLEINLNDAELEAENKKDAVADWLSKEGRQYFKDHAKQLPAFEKDPVDWYFKNKGKGDKTDYSKYSFWGN
jgi:hypothetical protein